MVELLRGQGEVFTRMHFDWLSELGSIYNFLIYIPDIFSIQHFNKVKP